MDLTLDFLKSIIQMIIFEYPADNATLTSILFSIDKGLPNILKKQPNGDLADLSSSLYEVSASKKYFHEVS